MNEINNQPVVHEASAVDDLRRIRTRFDQESHGDLRRHVAESRRITEQLQDKLGLKIAPSRTVPAGARASESGATGLAEPDVAR